MPPTTPEPLRTQIRTILLDDWDPTSASRNASSHGEYDGYIDPLWRLIEGGADEEAVVRFLKEREQESMCFPGLGTARLRRPAQKLLALRGGA
jgi:hypothetical protein